MNDLICELARQTSTKIVMVVIDGLGGISHPETGKTALETARTPALDKLVDKGMCGLSEPIGPGITPGSAPGHLALFGYDPIACNIGRGVLEALGIDFDLQPDDVAARGNFCTVDAAGLIADRRAGRISTENAAKVAAALDGWTINGVKIMVRPVREHRFVVIFRGQGLSPAVSETDPQQVGMAAKVAAALVPEAAHTADVVNQFVTRAKGVLATHYPANMLLLRGFSQHPKLPTMNDIYKLKPVAIASYPMYRGLAKLVGMDVLSTGSTLEDELNTLKQNYANYDFFFFHIKAADSAGEDGNYVRKVQVIEQADGIIGGIMDLKPDVLVVSGDHSTPAVLKGHSWHPVPLLLYSPWCRWDRKKKFSETECVTGGLGHISAVHIMPLAMAHALKLNKFGA